MKQKAVKQIRFFLIQKRQVSLLSCFFVGLQHWPVSICDAASVHFITWVSLSPCPPQTRKNNHLHNNSQNVNDICLFPSIFETNEELGARSGVVYRLTIRDSEGSLNRHTQMCGGSIKQRAKTEHDRRTHLVIKSCRTWRSGTENIHCFWTNREVKYLEKERRRVVSGAGLPPPTDG